MRRWPTELLVAAGFLAAVLGTSVSALVCPPQATFGRLIVLSLMVGLYSAVAGRLLPALTTALLAWPFFNAFLINQRGELSWHGSEDLLHIAVLTSATLAGYAGHRWHRNRQGIARADQRG